MNYVEFPHARYQVNGIGRVGSYAKAKQSNRSRAHRYWAICKWSDACTEYCKSRQASVGHHAVHYPEGHVEDPSHGRFKTKKQAEEYLAAMDKYLDADRTLARLLGYTWGAQQEAQLPRWTQNKGACMDLVIQHEIDIKFTYAGSNETFVETCDFYGAEGSFPVKDHDSKDLAVCYAVVTALIGQLERDRIIAASAGNKTTQPQGNPGEAIPT